MRRASAKPATVRDPSGPEVQHRAELQQRAESSARLLAPVPMNDISFARWPRQERRRMAGVLAIVSQSLCQFTDERRPLQQQFHNQLRDKTSVGPTQTYGHPRSRKCRFSNAPRVTFRELSVMTPLSTVSRCRCRSHSKSHRGSRVPFAAHLIVQIIGSRSKGAGHDEHARKGSRFCRTRSQHYLALVWRLRHCRHGLTRLRCPYAACDPRVAENKVMKIDDLF